MNPMELTETRIGEIIAGVAAYMRRERERYLPLSDPLTEEWKSAVHHYFPKALLDRIKIVTLKGTRIPTPFFYAEAQALSSGRFPDFVHMASFTYIDVIVFHEEINRRPLFHGVVHATQIAILGFEQYIDLYVRGFLKNRSWIAIPLEDQAYKLDARFAMGPAEIFSVEDEIRFWAEQGRYR
jgi:hypothetical protein